eukprot:TRINITY_DN15096_c0_g1_i1.p2 TRINITY_DN15096_c0_g1~~TRINITY_DN15096_c0_g1_i1.p2  ORF type:complete len:217 (+),score=46.14 TRINITY_DN15096_c0_g1_i1:86-736(+)
MPERVVIAIDASSHALAAFQQAKDLAKGLLRELVIVSIYDPLDKTGESPGTTQMQTLLNQLHEECSIEGIPSRSRLEAGTCIHERICHIAAEERASLLVVGTSGHADHTDKHARLGSIGTYCAEYGPCPTLVVRPDYGIHSRRSSAATTPAPSPQRQAPADPVMHSSRPLPPLPVHMAQGSRSVLVPATGQNYDAAAATVENSGAALRLPSVPTIR